MTQVRFLRTAVHLGKSYLPGQTANVDRADEIVANKTAVHVEQPTAEVAEATPDYEALTVAELKELAKAADIDGYYSLRKAELIKALTNGDN